MPKGNRMTSRTREVALRLAEKGWTTAHDVKEAAGTEYSAAGKMLQHLLEDELVVRRRTNRPAGRGQRQYEYTVKENAPDLFSQPAEKEKPRGRTVTRKIDKADRLRRAVTILFPKGSGDLQAFVAWMDYTRELMDE